MLNQIFQLTQLKILPSNTKKKTSRGDKVLTCPYYMAIVMRTPLLSRETGS